MPFEWPEEWPEDPSAPDGLEEQFFRSVEDEQPELAERLRRRYGERWIVAAHLKPPRLEDATVRG